MRTLRISLSNTYPVSREICFTENEERFVITSDDIVDRPLLLSFKNKSGKVFKELLDSEDFGEEILLEESHTFLVVGKGNNSFEKSKNLTINIY